MTITRLYRTIRQNIQKIHPQERVTRIRNMGWLMAGLFMARSIHLRHVARKIPGHALNTSKEKRLWRLVHNKRLRVRLWYEPVAQDVLQTGLLHGQKGPPSSGGPFRPP